MGHGGTVGYPLQLGPNGPGDRERDEFSSTWTGHPLRVWQVPLCYTCLSHSAIAGWRRSCNQDVGETECAVSGSQQDGAAVGTADLQVENALTWTAMSSMNSLIMRSYARVAFAQHRCPPVVDVVLRADREHHNTTTPAVSVKLFSCLNFQCSHV